MFFKKDKKSKYNSYQVGYSDGYNAGLSGNEKVFSMTFNKDRSYISGYEQGYRKGITQYRNKQNFNNRDSSVDKADSNNLNNFQTKMESRKSINLGTNKFRR